MTAPKFSPTRSAELLALADGADPGPWTPHRAGHSNRLFLRTEPVYSTAIATIHARNDQQANAEFILSIHDLVAELRIAVEVISELRAALKAYVEAYPHSAPHDCFATGPMTGDAVRDLILCPGCVAQNEAHEALSLIGE